MGFFTRLFNGPDATVAPAASNTAELSAQAANAILAEIDIDTAIAAHENWKLRLQNVLEGKSTEDLRPEIVCLDDRCELGKWLHGQGRIRLGGYGVYNILVARHRAFHVQASTVLSLAQAKNITGAGEVINSGYSHASSQVVLLLKELKRELKATASI